MMMQLNHTVQFQELLSITIKHGYYANNYCGDFDFELLPDTLKTIREYGIVVKKEKNRLILMMDNHKDFNHFCFRGEIQCNIKIKNKNPQFLQFTDLPYLSKQCIHFEHQPGRDLLHHGENVTFDLCEECSEDNGITGKITITLNKENELFGIGGDRKNKALPVRHTINFKERNVFWKYFIYGTSKYLEDVANMYIVEKQSIDGVTYSNMGPITLSNGKEAFLFMANHSLPLKERPSQQMGLYLNKGKNTEIQLIRSLPCPNPKSVTYDSHSGNFYVQEFIFI